MSELSEDRLLAEQRTGVGGSEVAHVFNEPPYGCARQLFYKKAGQPRDYDDPEPAKRRMRRGVRLETIAAEEYQMQTLRRAKRTSAIRDHEHPHRLVHVDRVLTGVSDPPAPCPGATVAPLELKVPGEAVFKKIVLEGLPPAYILQMQWALLLTGRPWGAFGILWADGWELLTFDVEVNAKLGQALAAAVDAFWAALARGEEPKRLAPGSPPCKRCPWRRTCWGDELVAMMKLSKEDQALELELAADLGPIVEDLLDAKRMAAEHDELLEAIADRLKAHLEDRELSAVEVGGHRVYYRQQKAGVQLDLDGLRAGMPPEALEWLYKTYGKPKKGARPLRIY